MKKIKYIFGFIGAALMFTACSDFLDVATQNGLDPDQANDAERFCNAAYASLMNQRDVKLWAWGDVRSDTIFNALRAELTREIPQYCTNQYPSGSPKVVTICVPVS